MSLPPWQEIEAARIGFTRRERAILNGSKPRHSTGSRWGGDIEGACAECFASRETGLPWTGARLWEKPPPVREPDLGVATEVRWSQNALNFDAEKDNPDWWYVLVSGFAPNFTVRGYIRGADCRREEWKKVYPERVVYVVPPSEMTALAKGHPLQ